MVPSKDCLRKSFDRLIRKLTRLITGDRFILPGDETNSVQEIEKSIGILLACPVLGAAIFVS
jgi:hypothetical protein